MPSDLRPALTITLSFFISKTLALIIVPGRILFSIWLCSNNSAKLSLMNGNS